VLQGAIRFPIQKGGWTRWESFPKIVGQGRSLTKYEEGLRGASQRPLRYRENRERRTAYETKKVGLCGGTARRSGILSCRDHAQRTVKLSGAQFQGLPKAHPRLRGAAEGGRDFIRRKFGPTKYKNTFKSRNGGNEILGWKRFFENAKRVGKRKVKWDGTKNSSGVDEKRKRDLYPWVDTKGKGGQSRGPLRL